MEDTNKTVSVVDVQFRPGQKVYYFDPNGIDCKPGDAVIIDTARGAEYGTCTSGIHDVPAGSIVSPLRPVLRRATAQDERMTQENRAREARAFAVCAQKITQHGLDMQLVSAEYLFDGSKLLFYFTADERVDFRELVKDLASIFHTRIELRQIGVRDKAKMVGGLGICGRPFCCASFLDDFQPVSIKMAKTQNLSLNPTKISGTCGRLMCCLKYEQDTYESLMRSCPKLESFVDTPEGRGTVMETDVLRQRVKVRMEENPETLSTFANDEIAVLRSGRPRKNDAPIPDDLAPISGSGKRVRPADEETMTLEPIRFRYREEEVVEEEPKQRRRKPKPESPKPEPPRQEPPKSEPPKKKKPAPRPQPPKPEAAQKPAPRPQPPKPEAAQKSAPRPPRPEGEAKKPPRRPNKPRPNRNKPQNRGESE